MKDILKDKLIIITGFGRSGTTILGKVLGSMQPSVYCFEPPLMKYLSGFVNSEIPAKLLFETHFLQEIQGRGNASQYDDSFYGHYVLQTVVGKRRRELRSREDAIKLLTDGYKFVVKSTELQHDMEFMDVYFPGVRFVHIVRNGFNSVASAVLRGWYTNEYCNSDIVETMHERETCNIPTFIDFFGWGGWTDWNAETRAACAWRCSVMDGLKFKIRHPDKCIQLSYEDFTEKPERYVRYFEKKLGLKSTFLTTGHLGNIYNASLGKKKTAPFIDKITEPERSRFFELNKRLGYKYNNCK